MANPLSQDLASLKISRDVGSAGRSSGFRLLLVILCLASLGIGGTLAYARVKREIFKTEITATEIALVSPAQGSITLTSTGYVVAQKLSRASSKVTGRISQVRVKEGDIVQAGQVIATLDDADQKSQVAAAGARVAAARARAEASRASIGELKGQLERERTLVDKGVSGRALFEDLTSRVMAREVAARASDAEVRAVQAEVDNLRVVLVDRIIVAPIDGTVLNKPPEVGEVIGPQALIVEIVDFRSLVVETDVPEARLHLIHPGDPCEIVLDAYPNKRYRGKALSIGKRVNRAKATVPVKVQLTDAAENVLPEMAARVSFLAKEISAEAMKEPPKHIVPASAVVDRAGGKVIFVVDQDKVRMVPITLGPAFGSGFELTNGPAPGTKIVDSPTSELADGKTIKEKGKE